MVFQNPVCAVRIEFWGPTAPQVFGTHTSAPFRAFRLLLPRQHGRLDNPKLSWPEAQTEHGYHETAAGRGRCIHTLHPQEVRALAHILTMGPLVGDHVAEAQVNRSQSLFRGQVEQLNFLSFNDME